MRRGNGIIARVSCVPLEGMMDADARWLSRVADVDQEVIKRNRTQRPWRAFMLGLLHVLKPLGRPLRASPQPTFKETPRCHVAFDLPRARLRSCRVGRSPTCRRKASRLHRNQKQTSHEAADLFGFQRTRYRFAASLLPGSLGHRFEADRREQSGAPATIPSLPVQSALSR